MSRTLYFLAKHSKRKMMRKLFSVLIALSLPSIGGAQTEDHILKADFRHRPPQMVIKEGKFSGPLKDIIEEAAKAAGYQIEWREVPFNRSLSQAFVGSTDLIPRVSYKPERAKFLEYSEPIGYRLKTTRFLVRKNLRDRIKVYEDLYQFSPIGTKLGTAYFDRFDNDPKIQKYGSYEDTNMSRMFIHQRFPVMAIVDKESIVEALHKHSFTDFAFSRYQHHDRLEIFYAFSKKSPRIKALRSINQALRQMVKSGSVQQIYEAYGIDNANIYIPLFDVIKNDQ